MPQGVFQATVFQASVFQTGDLFEAVGAPQLPRLTASGQALMAGTIFTGNGVATLAALIAAASALQTQAAAGAPALPGLQASGSAQAVAIASGAAWLRQLTVLAFGARQLVRPDETVSAGAWTPVGEASLDAATDDDLDSSYDRLLQGDDPSTMVLGLQTLDAPGVGDGYLRLRVEAVP